MTNRVETLGRQPWTYERTIPNESRVVFVDEVKKAIRISTDDQNHDENLLNLIDAATIQVEDDCSLALLDQTIVVSRDNFNSRYRFLVLPIRPAKSIVAITYVDQNGDSQTVDPATYRLNTGQNSVDLTLDSSWPDDVQSQVSIEYIAGSGDDRSDVPAQLRQAIMLQVGKWFQNPAMDMNEAAVGGDKPYERLIQRYQRSDYV